MNQMLSENRATRDLEPLIETLVGQRPAEKTVRTFPEASSPDTSPGTSPGVDRENLEDLLPSSSDPLSDPLDHLLNSFAGYRGRRLKSALLLSAVWSVTGALHLVSWGLGVGAIGAIVLGIHGFRAIATPQPQARPSQPPEAPSPPSADGESTRESTSESTRSDAVTTPIADHLWPSVALLVAAKDEERVIGETIEKLCELDFPVDRYQVWAINDNSSDDTGAVLDRLAQRYDHLRVIHRGRDARGGKSGALNLALQHITTDVIGVFDADARVDPDFLQQVLPLFDRPEIGAVQVRKSIANAEENVWTKGQAIEMVLDAYLQGQRHALGGIGELRGNGQFVRLDALSRCGYFNEVTITDDLDLSLRLHLDGWDVRCTTWPAVYEEGVTDAIALWHQRSRWAEGGYQRYMDYWRLLTSDRLSPMKRLDLVIFVGAQYLLPAAAIPDAIGAIALGHLPVWLPITLMSAVLTLSWISCGLRRVATEQGRTLSWLSAFGQAIRGTIFMLHWIVVMAATTTRMAFRPKRLKWVKTVHRGA
jgi:1,2-diacylglycerol 3-beta-glucosyltransferase